MPLWPVYIPTTNQEKLTSFFFSFSFFFHLSSQQFGIRIQIFFHPIYTHIYTLVSLTKKKSRALASIGLYDYRQPLHFWTQKVKERASFHMRIYTHTGFYSPENTYRGLSPFLALGYNEYSSKTPCVAIFRKMECEKRESIPRILDPAKEEIFFLLGIFQLVWQEKEKDHKEADFFLFFFLTAIIRIVTVWISIG